MNRLIRDFLRLYLKSALDVAPLVVVILFFQLAVIREPFAEPLKLLAGFFLLVTGLFFFMRGFHTALFPLGQSMTFQFAEKGNVWWLLAFCGLVGYSATIAEPALISLAAKAQEVSGGRYDAFWLRNSAAIGVAGGVVIGVLRIALGHPIQRYYIAGYTAVALITMIAPEGIIGVAFDFGGAALSTFSVPLLSAMGMGLASTIGGRNPMLDGFGIIGFAGMTPMIAIMAYGILVS
jgi:hypothetical protein